MTTDTYQALPLKGVNARLLVTDKALTHLKKQAAKLNTGCTALRIDVKKAGCSGMKYSLDYVKEALEKDETIIIDDEFSIHVAELAWSYVKGSIIDLVQEGLNARLKLENPNEKGSCGCGESVFFG